jgi:hypothetical protein
MEYLTGTGPVYLPRADLDALFEASIVPAAREGRSQASGGAVSALPRRSARRLR